LLFKHKRSEAEIIRRILSLAQRETKKTHLMYKTNMSYSLFIEYLEFLLKKNLLEKKTLNPSDAIVYKITAKGKRVLENVNNTLGCLK